MVQYLFKGQEHRIDNPKPHGNSKTGGPYRRVRDSIRDQLKASAHVKDETPKNALDKLYTSVGDVSEAKCLGQLPRGPSDVYYARYAEKKATKTHTREHHEDNTASKVGLDSLWIILERAKREEELSKGAAFIRECSIHPGLVVVLASDRQLKEVAQFCTNPNDLSVFGVDPTFNVFEQNISLTVTSYRNLRLEKKGTGKPPVFLGPMLIHQQKDWRTFSKFAYHLIEANPDLEGLLACGTDGKKALIDGFKRNFRFAVFLRCFLHFKDNLKRELISRGLKAAPQQQFIDEIFGKVDGKTKHYGLVDCDSEADFRTKLGGLKDAWDTREKENANITGGRMSFYEWFCKEKVFSFIYFIQISNLIRLV